MRSIVPCYGEQVQARELSISMQAGHFLRRMRSGFCCGVGLAALVLAGFATFGELVMNAIEDDWGYVNSAYWAVATLTGVGYGDYAPTDKTGRLFTCVPALVPIRPRSRGERRSLRTFPGASLRPGSLAFNPRPRRL